MPSKNLFFTIVTGNYIPMANLLGDSIRLCHPEADYKIVVVRGFDPEKGACPSPYDLIPVEELGLERLNELAFKYDLTEFCTSIKPSCFKFFFETGYNKIVYFDPDIYVFNPLEPVLKALDAHPICITPHLLYPETKYTGHWPQGRLLAAGVYNLGFIGLSNVEQAHTFVEWWEANLLESCYSERRDGLFTDQKWVNLCPVFFPETKILNEPGCNFALWNIHERELEFKDGSFLVRRRGHSDGYVTLLYFFHFSNFRFRQAEKEFECFLPFSLTDYPDAIPAVESYRLKLAKADFVQYNKQPDYRFNYFDNGIHINKIHRRLYRKLLQTGISFENPFSTEQGSFYSILKRNNLVAMETGNMDTEHLRSSSNGSSKFSLATTLLRWLVRAIGVKRYTFLCRFMNWLSKYENQLFLIQEYKDKASYNPPKEYINTND